MYRLHQTPISCSSDGHYLWVVHKIVLSANGAASAEVLEDPVCEECPEQHQRYIELLTHAVKVEPLSVDERLIIKESANGKK